MGLNFKQSNAYWSYSGFNSFRRRLAAMIDIDLDAMEGFDGEVEWETVNDPIKPFLNHSDCDGELTPQECLKVAPRLKGLVAAWEDGHDKNTALELADDMLKCAKQGKSLIFT